MSTGHAHVTAGLPLDLPACEPSAASLVQVVEYPVDDRLRIPAHQQTKLLRETLQRKSVTKAVCRGIPRDFHHDDNWLQGNTSGPVQNGIDSTAKRCHTGWTSKPNWRYQSWTADLLWKSIATPHSVTKHATHNPALEGLYCVKYCSNSSADSRMCSMLCDT